MLENVYNRSPLLEEPFAQTLSGNRVQHSPFCGLSWQGFLFLSFFCGRFWYFFGFLVLCFPASLLFCFSAVLLLCFSASLLFCFSLFPLFAFLLLCFSAFVLLCLSTIHFFSFLVMCFSFSSASCLYCLIVLFLHYCLLFVLNETLKTLGETQRPPTNPDKKP